MSGCNESSPKLVSYELLFGARDSIVLMKSAVPYDLDPRLDEVLELLERRVKELGEELGKE